jgi:hypothetical protein
MRMADQAEGQVNINRARLGSLTLYDVTEDELDMLQNGPSNGIWLNMACALIPVSVTLTATLMTVNILSTRTFIVFVIVTVLTGLTGIIAAIVWYSGRRSYTSIIITRVKSRNQQLSATIASTTVAAPNSTVPSEELDALTESLA